uniref:Retrotransposon protein, putative, Ty1-copia subclass n=1 Tax=Oryza sativa subsp. japonica TaxID=39947 RepID=Q2R4V6_ORYSJ|nr:retrotransposon protein, putative, Ty1-copia subclass [Oryza sativa Japonica Group]
MVNAMLDTVGLQAWWGEALLTSNHVLNRVPNRNKDKTPYEQWIERKPSLSYLCTWGFLVNVNVPITKKCKLGTNTVDRVFLGYAHYSIAYRFLIVKSEDKLNIHMNISLRRMTEEDDSETPWRKLDEIYMDQPYGFIVEGIEGKVCKFDRTLILSGLRIRSRICGRKESYSDETGSLPYREGSDISESYLEIN